MGQIQNLDDLLGLLIRRRLVICAVAVFGIVMTLLYVMAKPDVFESTAVLQVQAPTITTPDAVGAQENSAQRLQAIQQQLTTRENMLAVIARHGLYDGTALTDDQKVHLLRISLRFETVASAATSGFGQGGDVSALLISAQGDTRAKAARVANDFAQGILDAGATGQMERAMEALRFFREEERALKASIEAKEAEIAAYQSRNINALPAQSDVLRSELTGIETELRTLDQALVGARNERAAIERKTNLRATDQRQLDSLTAQIETLAAQGTALGARRAEIATIIAQSQDVGRAMAEFERDLAQLQAQYALVSRRSADAETAAKLQDRQQGEAFTILERAAEPDYPISGGRRKLAMVGAMASVILGMVVAFVLDHLRPVLRTQSQLERELDLRAIVAIPELRPSGGSLRHRFAKEMPALSDLTAKTAGSAGSIPGLTPLQSLAAGGAVLALLAIAIALT